MVYAFSPVSPSNILPVQSFPALFFSVSATLSPGLSFVFQLSSADPAVLSDALYAAQGIPQFDAEIAQKSHFRMETKYSNS